MADIYDVNAAIQKPNLLASVQQGYAFGTQQRQVREQEQRENQLRGLAPDILSGKPGAYEQAAAIDPQAAQQYQGAGDNQLRRLKGGMDYLRDALASGNPQRIAAAEAQVGPYVARLANKPWTPGALTADPAAFEQAYAKISMIGQDPQAQEPAGYRQAHLTAIAAGYQPGTPEYQNAMRVAAGTAPRSIPAGFTTRTYRDANGQEVVELVQIRGEGAGPTMPAGQPQPSMGQPAPQMTTAGAVQPSSAEELVAQIEAQEGPLPPDVRARILADVQRNGGRFDSGAAVPPQAMPVANRPLPPLSQWGAGDERGGAGRGQTDADRARAEAQKAAMVEEAKLRTQMGFAPEQARLDADREEAVVSARESATTAAERKALAPETVRRGEMLVANIDALLNDPNLAIATGASGALDPRAWPIADRASGVADTKARISQIQGDAFLQAFQSLKGGGAITQVEGTKAEQAIARLTTAQSDEGFRAALTDFKAAIQPAIDRAKRLSGNSGGPLRPGTVEDGYRFRGGDPADQNNWERI